MRCFAGIGTLSSINCTKPGKSSVTTRPPITPAAIGTEAIAKKRAFSPKIAMPKGSVTRKVMKTPEKPQTFSKNFAAVPSTVRPLKRAASKRV